MQYIDSVTTSASHPTPPIAEGEPSTSSERDTTVGSTDCDEGMAEEPDSVQEFESGCPSITKETSDFGCQVNTRGGQLMLKSVGTQTDHKVIFCDQNTQTEPELFDKEISISDDELDPANEHDITETVSPHKADPSFVPPKMDESDDDNDDDDDEKLQSDTENSTSPNPQEDVKFLVFEKELHELFKRCQECGEAVMKKETSTQGTQLYVTLKCTNGHIKFWKSQPMLKGMPAGNLLMASSILLSGATYTKIASLAEF